jgi:hypothetical protein
MERAIQVANRRDPYDMKFAAERPRVAARAAAGERKALC